MSKSDDKRRLELKRERVNELAGTALSKRLNEGYIYPGPGSNWEDGYRTGYAAREGEVERLREALRFVVFREDHTFAECTVAEEIMSVCKQALKEPRDG